VKDARFDRLGAFTYSPEEDTDAFKLTDNVTKRQKIQRQEEIMSVQEVISGELNRKKIGSSLKVIVDRVEGDFFIARSEYDSPEVDNEILISVKNNLLVPGSFYNVKIFKADSFDLYGEIE